MPRFLDAVAPARLGSDFRWLIGSSWSTNLADGIALTAGPLLIEDQTGSASLVGVSWLLGRLPWLLFGLHAGYLADRLDRRVVVMAANAARTVVLAVLVLALVSDQVNVAIILAALFLLGVAEVFADTTAHSLLPMIVDKSDLTLGNARLIFGHVGLNMLVGPPVGAALFAVGLWIPFAAQGIAMALGVVLVQRIVLSRYPAPEIDSEAAVSPRTEILDGIRWVWANPAVRTLALTIFFFNITFGGSFAVMVVLAKERFGLDEVGFGFMTAMAAIGGITGTVIYKSVEDRVGIVTIMRVGLMIEAATHLILAISTTAAIAFAILFLFGIHESMWGTTSSSIRHAAVPNEFQGRVGSVYMFGLHGGLVVGAGLGSILAGGIGITAPYWFGFIGSVVVLALIWGQLRSIAQVAALEPEPVEP